MVSIAPGFLGIPIFDLVFPSTVEGDFEAAHRDSVVPLMLLLWVLLGERLIVIGWACDMLTMKLMEAFPPFYQLGSLME